VVSLEPSSLEDVFSTIAFVGDLVGARDGAAALVASLRERVAALRARNAAGSPARVLVLEWTDPPMSGGPLDAGAWSSSPAASRCSAIRARTAAS